MTEILVIPSKATNAIIWHFREVCENPVHVNYEMTPSFYVVSLNCQCILCPDDIRREIERKYENGSVAVV